jgi:hypothetical protein
VTLVNLGAGPMAITCTHVLSGYRKRLQTTGRAIFQVGSIEIDPLSQLIAEDVRLDLAMVQLTEAQAKAITGEGEIGSCFFQPVGWPPPPVKEGDFVAFGGFPGRWRERHTFDELVFSTFSMGACRVASVADDRFACQFEREYWVKSFDMDNRDDLRDMGGMSGGPAFIQRGLYWDFIGVIYEFSSAYDIMFLRPTHLFRADGTIDGSHV